MESFLTSIETFLKLMPDFRPKNLQETIRSKSKILYYPMALIDENIFLREEHMKVARKCEVGDTVISAKHARSVYEAYTLLSCSKWVQPIILL